MEEIWREIEDFKYYYISNYGRLKSLFPYKKEKFLKDTIDSYGYIRNGLIKDGKIIQKHRHRLVADAFIPNTENKPTVDHINRIEKTNNTVSNLRWATYKEQANNIGFVKNHKNGYGSHIIERIDKIYSLRYFLNKNITPVILCKIMRNNWTYNPTIHKKIIIVFFRRSFNIL
jgi:hypothetical protein